MMADWLRPMLATPADAVPTVDGWIAEPKLDGWRCVIHRGERINVYGGRNGANYSGQLPYLEAEVFARLPKDTVIDGELMSPLGFNNVQSIMRTNGGHMVTHHSPALYVVAFDVLMVNGTDVRGRPWVERRQLLDGCHFDEADHLRRTLVLPCNDNTLEAALDFGFEGVVCKREQSRYESGRRARTWLKLKPQQTAEARVIGFKPGTGDLAGLVGAFVVEMLDSGVRTTVKCGTRKRHEDATDHPERWLHTVIEIKHNGIGQPSLVPRHPQFFRRREDR